jgi:hypothetical protein
MRKILALFFVLLLALSAVPLALGEAGSGYSGEDAPSCVDSDEGKDFWTAGITKLSGGLYEEDSCEDSVLYEYYCVDEELTLTRYKCEYGCKSGACLKVGPVVVSTAAGGSASSSAVVVEPAQVAVASTVSVAPVKPVRVYDYDDYDDYSEKDLLLRIEKLEKRVAALEKLVVRMKGCCGIEPVPVVVEPVEEPSCAAVCADSAAECKDGCRKEYEYLATHADDEYPKMMGLCYEEKCKWKMQKCLDACPNVEPTKVAYVKEDYVKVEPVDGAVVESETENVAASVKVDEVTGKVEVESESEEGSASVLASGQEVKVESKEKRRNFFDWLFGR